jgi:uncharacterized protein (DUF427 family)
MLRIEGMEKVWNYPRPPAVAPCERRVRVEIGGEVLAQSTSALRVLETSHPPTVYVPADDVRVDLLAPSQARPTWCEFKGVARYLDAIVAGTPVAAVGWTYPDPSPGYEALRDHIAFFPGRVDAAWMGDELVSAQASDFYGGWITADLVGPFKGPPGTLGW